MQYRLLGPLEVVHDGVAVDVGSPKQRVLLAALLLERGRSVSADRLVEAIWGDEPPPAPQASLQAYVSNLRRALRPVYGGHSPLDRQPPGYVLRVPAEELDVTTFLRAVDEARAAEAAGDLDRAALRAAAALAVWRGPVLAELADQAWVATTAGALEERRTEAAELHARALLGTGRLAEALGAVQQLVDDHPFRDGARELQLTALHRAGRSAEALEAYRGYARLLADELGLEPGPRLREIHAQVLRQEPATPPAPRPSPAAPPPAPEPRSSGAGLVGREREIAAVDRLLAEVRGARTRWLVLTGPAGIGKSRLAEETVARARAAGGRDAWTRCPDDEGVPAWWPLRQVVRALGVNPDQLLVPPSGVDADSARFAVYERLLTLLSSAAADGPLTVVVDDVQWADSASLRCLAYLVSVLRERPIAVVLTLRDGEGSAEVTALLAAVARSEGAVQLAVPPLSTEAVADLVRAVAGDEVAASDVRLLTDRTGGNPLFVSEYARLPREERSGTALPVAVRAVLGRRLSRLPDDVLTLLRMAAVAGEELDVPLLADATGLPLDVVADRLERAADDRIITTARGDDDGSYSFAHGLLREEVLAQLPALRRQRLHARLADALAHRAETGDTLSRRAAHLVSALPLVEPRTVVEACTRAATDAEARWDSDAAAAWWEQALVAADRLAPSERDEDARDDLLVARLTALARAGRGQTALDVVDAALVEATRVGRLATVGRLAGVLLRSSGGWPWTTYGTDPGVVQARLAELTDRVAPDPGAHVRVLAVRAVGNCYHPDPAVPDGLSRRAVDLAEQLGDPDALADALVGRILTYVGVADHAHECIELADRLVALPHSQSAVDEVLRHNVLSMARGMLGEVDAAVEHVRAGIAGSDRMRLPVTRVQLRWAEAMFAQWRGELELAEQLVQRAMQLHQQTELYASGVSFMAHLSVLWDLGRIAERPDEVAAAPAPLVWQAVLAAEVGDVPAARRLLDDAVPAQGPFVWDTLAHQTLLAHVAADIGAADHAATLLGRLAPYAGCIATVGQVGMAGPVALALGRLAALLGDVPTARAHLRTAAGIATRAGGRPALLRTRLAEALLDPPGPARDVVLREVARGARALGMRGVLAAAEAALAS